MFLAGLWFATMRRPFRDYHVLADLWQLDWPFLRQLIVIGTPISIASLMQYGVLSAAALLAGLISTSALAAHQIALQITVITSMISFGISMAAAVRVGHAVGRNDGSGIQRAGLVAILLGTLIAALLTVAVIVARFEIAELFLDKSAGDADATIGLTAELLIVAASRFVSDAAQSIAAGGLRGLKDTRVPLLFVGIAYWLIGFSLGYVLGLKIGLGAIGIWIGLSIGTTIYAGLLILRFHLLASRRALRAVTQWRESRLLVSDNLRNARLLTKCSLSLHTEASRLVRKKMLNRVVTRSCGPFYGTSKRMCRPTWPPSGQHSTEPSKVRIWLARCPRWHLHFTPPMPPASIRSNASSRSSTNAPIRHGRRRKKSGSFLALAISRPFMWTASPNSTLQYLARLCRRTSGTELRRRDEN
ncbi:MATE family efflux transporter [Bradyrhizobium sp. 87]|uniref:MATE family efflux transporter n=1 Tax=Bradyrhizobium sp. 87 TaxID=2782682 RepID=UPI001FF7802A|nr:MATE family efflux transporter [Bradyrhizobium sp. 87]